jgi:hypothetical protein
MPSHIDISPEVAQSKALAFIAAEWTLPPDDQEWLSVLSARLVGESWYVVELGVEGLPDKWAVQVYDTGECDPDYSFMSPIAALDEAEASTFPPAIAAMLKSERQTLHAVNL